MINLIDYTICGSSQEDFNDAENIAKTSAYEFNQDSSVIEERDTEITYEDNEYGRISVFLFEGKTLDSERKQKITELLGHSNWQEKIFYTNI